MRHTICLRLHGNPGSGYSSTGPNEAVLEAAQNGVNVVIWNFIILTSDPQTGEPLTPHMATHYTLPWCITRIVILFSVHDSLIAAGNPVVSGAPPLSCVVDTVKALEAQNLTTTHLISIGGWDAPHPAAFNPVTGKPYTALEVFR